MNKTQPLTRKSPSVPSSNPGSDLKSTCHEAKMEHLHSKTIRQLEEQLYCLRQKERRISEMQAKIKQVGEQECNEDHQIAQLKQSLQQMNQEISVVEETNKKLRNQLRKAHVHMSSLELVLSNTRQEMRNKRRAVQIREQDYAAKQVQLQRLQKDRRATQFETDSLKQEIRVLEDTVRRQMDTLHLLTAEREHQQRTQQQLKSCVLKLKRQLHQRRGELARGRERVEESKQEVEVLSQQLDFLIREEDQCRAELQNQRVMQDGLQMKRRALEQQIHAGEKQLEWLTGEYVREGQENRKEEMRNEQLNKELDRLGTEAYTVWERVQPILKRKAELHNKSKAYQIWIQIAAIINK